MKSGLWLGSLHYGRDKFGLTRVRIVAIIKPESSVA